jgi:hypothetical protein
MFKFLLREGCLNDGMEILAVTSPTIPSDPVPPRIPESQGFQVPALKNLNIE